MSLKIFSQAPYYDDYDEAKKYLRVLFRPGVSLQVRELNQLQTYLQSQIERFGLHLFKEGAMVIPGQSSVDTKTVYLKVHSETDANDINAILSQLTDKVLTGSTSGVQAQVITTAVETSDDPTTVYVRYTTSGDNQEDKSFALGEYLLVNDLTINGSPVRLQLKTTSDSIGNAAIAAIQQGIYFVKGQFVQVDAQTIILDKYSNNPSYRIGLRVLENVVRPDQDPNLNDNANGVPNENAPGAYRYQILLTFDKIAIDSTDDTNFIELIRIDGGSIQSKVTTTEYSVLAQTLARRTYDESGDYTIKPFKVAIREHRNNDRGAWTNISGTHYKIGDVVKSGGIYFTAVTEGIPGAQAPFATYSATNPYQVVSDGNLNWNYTANPVFNRGYLTPEKGGDESYAAVAVEPGKAYVRGYEIEKIATEYVSIPKARTYKHITSDAVATNYGNYVYVTNVHGIPDFGLNPTIGLFDTLTPSVNPQTAGSGTQVGTAKVRAIEFDSGASSTTAAGVYKLYLYDVTMNSGYTFERNVKQFFYNSGATLFNFAADVTSNYVSTTTSTVTATTTSGTTTYTIANTTWALAGIVVGDVIRIQTTSGYELRKILTIPTSTTATSTALTGTISTGVTFTRVQTVVNEPGALPAIFQLAVPYVRKVREGDNDNIISTAYTTTQRFDKSSGSDGSLTINLDAPYRSTVGGNEFTPSASKHDFICINKASGLVEGAATITINSSSVTLTGLTASTQFSVLAPVHKVAQEKRKKLRLNTTKDFATLASVTPTTLLLDQADGVRIVAIKMSANFTTAVSSDPTVMKDITSWFSFDNGQRDTHYDLARIIRNDGYPVPTGQIRVIYDYFEHGDGSVGDYFTVDSYTDIPYANIPYYISSNGLVALTDVLDFRPRVNSSGVFEIGSKLTELPKFGFDTISSYSYYLPRSDKLALDISGKFFTIQGDPSTNPEEPKDPNLAMLLAKLRISAFTLYPDKGSIAVETFNTKRYTMEDIGKIDKRVENLEYYTALSLLEQETKSLTIRDSSGIDRFKNGFIVDSFKGQDLGDVGSNDYICSIDMNAQELRPFYTMTNVNLIESDSANRSSLGYELTGDMITLPYDHVEFIKQPYASRVENVNPFAVFTFLGSITLNPPSDEWFEVNRKPDVIVDVEGNFAAVQAKAQADGVLGTVWGAWETQWVGASRTVEKMVVKSGFDSTDYGLGAGRWNSRYNFTQAELAAIGGNATSYGQDGVGKRVLTYTQTATTVGIGRVGVSTSVIPKIDYQVVDDKVLQSAVIPYIRSRELLFVCKGLKPNTKLYPFFDESDIAQYVTPATRIAVTNNGVTTFNTDINVGDAATEAPRQVNLKSETSYNKGDVVFVSRRGNSSYQTQLDPNVPATAVVVMTEKSATGEEAIYVMNIKGNGFQPGDIIKGSISSAEYTINASQTITPAVRGDTLVTNFNGSIAGVFSIPNTESIRFRTGIRDFKLTDSKSGALDYTTQGRTQYRAQGILETRQKTINAVRNAELAIKPVSETTTTEVYSDWNITRDTGWYDPLAQTFLVQSTGGAFITKVDVFFASKDIGVPVTLQIREVENGYPASTILPFSRVTLTPDKINISGNTVDIDGTTYFKSDTPTSFVFDSPVYLQDNTEYCIVLMSDSNNYRVWISQLGEKNEGTDRFISDQPYAGVLFKSQNASTWTANQEQDLKFTIYKAKFDTVANPTISFQNEPLPPTYLDADPFQTAAGSSLVRVFHRNHGMQVGNHVIIAGVTAASYNGIATTATTGLNGTFTITAIESDSYIVDIGTNATLSGIVGGYNVIATQNVAYDAVNIIAQTQLFTDTALSFGLTTMDTSNNVSVVDTPIVANTTAYMDTARHVLNPINELSVNKGKSMTLNAVMSSDNENVSPVIDTARLSAITIKNKIDNYTIASKNNVVIDVNNVISSGAGVTFSSSSNNISIPVAFRSAVKQITAGKYLMISSTTSNNTTDPVLVTAVATDGSTITTSGHTWATESPAATTIKMYTNYTDEIAPIGGSSESKYVTKVINLENPSTFLKIMFAANVPAVSGTDIQVYYKLLPTGSSTDISQFNYVQVDSTKIVKPIVKTSNSTTFYDVEFDMPGLNAFDALVVKLVFKSGNSAQVPRVKDLRIIACA